MKTSTNKELSDFNLSPIHSKLTSVIWSVADNLRGTYRPPQYRGVMLPLIVLARFDAVLAPYTDLMKEVYDKDQAEPEHERMNEIFLGKAIFAKIQEFDATAVERKNALYNTSGFNLQRIIADAENISANLNKYIQGFSPKARDIFAKFEFENEIIKLDEKNILFKVVNEFVSDIKKAGLKLSPEHISNLQMGYVFEDLVRRFNEQANEDAGDHFTPREVIDLMVNVIFAEDKDELIVSGTYKSIYDPTAGTGGMLSVAEKHLKSYNQHINLTLYGQEYNSESYAICCADLLIKDEPADNIIYGNTLGVKDTKSTNSLANDFVAEDGHKGKKFHYMFANPPYGVKWANEESFIRDEAEKGFDGRFGAGLPRINDGSLLFLQHMIDKMHNAPDDGGDGSRIAVVFNGSPMFTGDAGSGESNIRRWIIENDWLEAVIALPDQMFYNTGIYTYIWIVSNKKSDARKGKVQLIDGTQHYQKMRKSLGSKRHELSQAHIDDITKLYSDFEHDKTSSLIKDKHGKPKVASKIFNNSDFAHVKITVDRPLRLNFQISAERIAKLESQSDFINLATSKKKKDAKLIAEEEQAGKQQQTAILDMLKAMQSDTLYKDRAEFIKVLDPKLKALTVNNESFKVSATIKNAIIEALSERDQTAEACKDSKGNLEADSQLKDTELVPLPANISLPLPLHYDNETGLDELIDLVKEDCEAYMQAEVLPHVPDAWVDYSKTKIGYDIPLNRHFYVYEPPRPLADIKADIETLEQEVLQLLKGLDV
ncbi:MULTISPECIES: N-6 DNA methylase [unclassified Acinetobacter]|uniref:type I restriction-modification system subunit M n=1 Tax=unclassified Acinetobacter TaxID=196816 RepID=UPI0035B75975